MTSRGGRRPASVTDDLISILTDRWSLRILTLLADRGRMRRAHLWRATDGVSQKVLTTCLRRLEARGLVRRLVEHDATISVSHEVTELGRSFLGVVSVLRQWSDEHADELGRTPAEPAIGQ